MGWSVLGRVDGGSGRPGKATLGVGQLWSVWAVLRAPFAGAWGGAQNVLLRGRAALKSGPGALPLGWRGCSDPSGAAALPPGKPPSQAVTALFGPRACAVADLDLDLAGMFLGVPACPRPSL